MRVLLIVLALAGTATADSYSFEGSDHNAWHDAHPEISAAIAQRDGQLAGATIHGRQAEIALARRGKRLTTELAYDLAIVGPGAVHGGWLRQRLGLAVIGGYANSLRRYDAWIEAGGGFELYDWVDETRPAVSLGFGADFNSGNDHSFDGSALHWLGARLAVRILAAPAPTSAAACAGGCTSPPPRAIDLAITFGLSVLIGR